ncbi:MAG TPA: hypothetical protein VJT74_02825, partial [Pyrinomonadaceae bacterium]|nr:hypothetical protein [Pyrinomonadaceae bacterium]
MENTNLDPAPDQADGGKIQDDLTRRILIAYSDGRSLSEIAKLHGLQVETVAEVLSRAIRNLVPGAGGIREKIKERYKENILDPLRRRAGVIGGPPKLEA